MGQILGELGPPGDFSPIVSVGLLLPRSDKVAHLFFSDATEEKEEPGEDALIRGD